MWTCLNLYIWQVITDIQGARLIFLYFFTHLLFFKHENRLILWVIGQKVSECAESVDALPSPTYRIARFAQKPCGFYRGQVQANPVEIENVPTA